HAACRCLVYINGIGSDIAVFVLRLISALEDTQLRGIDPYFLIVCHFRSIICYSMCTIDDLPAIHFLLYGTLEGNNNRCRCTIRSTRQVRYFQLPAGSFAGQAALYLLFLSLVIPLAVFFRWAVRGSWDRVSNRIHDALNRYGVFALIELQPFWERGICNYQVAGNRAFP